MTPGAALAYLTSRPASTIRLGLERMQVALDLLERPDRRYPILQVAGTNGKGSTCAFASTALAAHGLRVGRFTSPHLLRLNERFWVSGEEISDGILGQRTAEVLDRLGSAAEELTYFELGTVVALWHFAQERVDAAVLEVGLGGRLDATTATTPAVAAVASISLDHTEILGSSLALVAAEKAGVFKPGVPAVVSAQPEDAARVLRERAVAVGAPLRVEGEDFAMERATPSGGRFVGQRWRFLVPHLSLRGDHQLHNAALALAALEQWSEGRWTLREEVLARALGRTEWPGRLEELAPSPRVLAGVLPRILVDGAHNPAGAEALARALPQLYPGEAVHLVFGVLADKDAAPMRELLFAGRASIHLTPLPNPRSAPAQDSEPDARRHCSRVLLYDGVESALEGAVREAATGAGGAGRPGQLVLCAGSLVLVGLARQWAAGSTRR